MRIALINGSPKAGSSTSRALLTELKSCFCQQAEVIEVNMHKTSVSKEVLDELEQAHWPKGEIFIYGIVNCGFYEGMRAEYALRILENWCVKTGFCWAGGVGVGGGGGFSQMPTVKNGHGPKAPVERVLKGMAERIVRHELQENQYVSVAFPRFLYKMAAQMGWRQMVKANGGKAGDLGKRPEKKE